MRARFRYPELRVIYQPEGVPPSSARAFAKFSEPGVYSTTVTQPEDFRAYLLEQLEPLVEEFGATIEVGVGCAGNPLPLRVRERRRARPRRRDRLRARALLSHSPA